MRISDWSSDVCSSDLCPLASSASREPERDLSRCGLVAVGGVDEVLRRDGGEVAPDRARLGVVHLGGADHLAHERERVVRRTFDHHRENGRAGEEGDQLTEEGLVGVLGVVLLGEGSVGRAELCRSEEHTSELQSLMRISYAVFCLKKKK